MRVLTNSSIAPFTRACVRQGEIPLFSRRYTRRMNLRQAPASKELDLSEDISELRRSHEELALQVASLVSDVQKAGKSFYSERFAIYNYLPRQEDRMFMRIVQFTSLRPRKILLAQGSKLGKSASSFYPSNSVVQTAVSDCTLSELQLFASHLMRTNLSSANISLQSTKCSSPVLKIYLAFILCFKSMRICARIKEWMLRLERLLFTGK